ncbi:MAG: hypothetical protein AAFV43_15880 [Planctomycetota bacterium]
MSPLLGLGVLALLMVGCDGPLTFTQRLAGKWRGRPESALERIEREWPSANVPGKPKLPPDPDEVADTAATVLEAASGVSIEMRLDVAGSAKLALEGSSTLEGEWRLVTAEGRRGVIEIEVDRDADEDMPAERRRFRVVFVPPAEGQPERFTLAEQGADPLFGRLLFERVDGGDESTGATDE